MAATTGGVHPSSVIRLTVSTWRDPKREPLCYNCGNFHLDLAEHVVLLECTEQGDAVGGADVQAERLRLAMSGALTSCCQARADYGPNIIG